MSRFYYFRSISGTTVCLLLGFLSRLIKLSATSSSPIVCAPVAVAATGTVARTPKRAEAARVIGAVAADNPPATRNRFEALHCEQQLHVFNPCADVGVVTLWSTVRSVLRVLQKQHIDLEPASSRIAVIANLYGNGLSMLLRNLLWNPQIRHLLVLGRDLSGSKDALINFFSRGLESVDFLGTPMQRIVGTRHIMDGGVRPQDFAQAIGIHPLGLLSNSTTKAGICDFFDSLPAPHNVTQRRIEKPLCEVPIQHFPSDASSLVITREKPLDAWEELIFRLHRFGRRNKVAKRGANGTYYEQERAELQNVQVNILQPEEEAAEHLQAYHFSLAALQEGQQKILQSEKPEDQTYTYGHRLRGSFKNGETVIDTLTVVAEKLRCQPESRHSYISLWDSGRDLLSATGHPCMVSLFFRRVAQRLSLTATFRTHNAFEAWLPNAYTLIAIQRFVAERAQMERGTLTMISHSISLDPATFDKSKAVADGKQTAMIVERNSGKRSLRFDPNGALKITIDQQTAELVVEHIYDEMKINQYRARSAEEMEHLLSRDCVVSDISHAFYVGRELTKAEARLRDLLRARK